MKRSGETEFLLSDAEKLVLKDNGVDVIMSAQLLEHVFNPTAVLEEYSRVLKSGGILILTLPTLHFAKALIAKVFRRRVKFISPFHVREYGFIKMKGVTSFQELFKELNSLNFKIIKRTI